ncbi:hypothetical protein MUN82_08795 [Hymenobacter aerilatus]|uniref:Uncharacterized protein n=1 Tax=Hymenobacter aerilatus TaxID=2932251 RepID=A0A8T9T3K8_9BACT|nr:hypothetical protein [Hymenobacter aerilatus]UOR07180.1 hypothetical protein MUN82_08795 [Hymenobacter aerilatus]
MELFDSRITALLGQPFEEEGKWWMRVEADTPEGIRNFEVSRDTKEQIESIVVGDKLIS